MRLRSGGSKGGTPSPTNQTFFSQFHAVLCKIWQNHMLQGWRFLQQGILDQPLLSCDIINNSITWANKLNTFLLERSRRVHSHRGKAIFLSLLLTNVNIELNILTTYPKNDVVFMFAFPQCEQASRCPIYLYQYVSNT